MAITKKSSTSDSRRSLNIAPWLLLGALVGMSGTADARKPKKNKNPVVEAPAPEPAPAPAPKTPSVKLFDSSLPISIGPLPDGLANVTSQACAACHFDSHDAWQTSAHATGWASEAFRSAVDQASTPACTSCHLPFLEQSPDVVAYDNGDLNKPLLTPNPTFNASLRLEGVTCAACHVRDGKIVASRPPEELGAAPHPMTWSEDLSTSKACASCHQLQWDGSKSAFYDTYGEWERSPAGKAGLQCQDCHGGSGAGRTGFSHGMQAGSDRAVSILLALPSVTLVRGNDPVPLGLTLQNTGAGHAYPTGSPFKGVRLRVKIVGPADRKGKIFETVAFEHDLARTLTEGAPWDVVEDTRIVAGGQVDLETELSVPYNAPEGNWVLRVELVETVRGEPTERPPLSTRTLPLNVE